jgi:hypothetical protein
MIIRHDVTADTYDPRLIPDEALQSLQEAFGVHAPDVDLDLSYTDDGVAAHDVPYVSVTVPGITDEAVIIIRSERGWQMHRGGNGPLYEFATEREVAEFLGYRMVRPLR